MTLRMALHGGIYVSGRICMTNQSLSDVWSENRSKDAGADLASVLDAARIIAQSLSPEIEVIFAGVRTADTNRRQIRLSPKILEGGEYPVPGNKGDVLLGLTVHEVGHTMFSENKVIYTDRLESKAHVYGPGDRRAFDGLLKIFEDVYVDHLMTAYPGYKDYLARERAWALGEFNPDSVSKPLEAKCTRADMLNALIYLTLADGNVPAGISQDNLGTLGKIAGYANKMCTKKMSKDRAIINAWNIIKTLPTTLTDEDRGLVPTPAPSEPQDEGEDKSEATPISQQAKNDTKREQEIQDELEKDEETETEQEAGGGDEEQEDEDKDEGETEDETTEGIESDTGEEGEPELETDLDLASRLDGMVDDKTSLPRDLADEVSEAIVEKRADLTQLLSYLAKDSQYTIIAYTPPEDAEAAANARSKTSSAEEKLRRILQDYRLRRTRDYRGLMSGRISGRRLHRVAYGDQRVFQRREKPEEIDMAVCLLMDLSGSVCRQRPLIEQITCAITDAFTKEKMELIALGYSENEGTVMIPRLYDREVGRVSLGLEKEWGMTPSYEGLAAATAQLLRLTGKKQKILFHFTDGEPNVGKRTIPELLDEARSKGIIDIHVCLTGRDAPSGMFKTLYGEDTMIINDIDELPDVIDKELRRRLKI